MGTPPRTLQCSTTQFLVDQNSSVIKGSLSAKNSSFEGTLNMSGSPPQTPNSKSSIGSSVLSSPGGRSLTTWKDFDESSDLTTLNSNLEKYIELVKNLEKNHVDGLKSTGETVINVNIDRRKTIAIHSKYTSELSAVQEACKANSKKIADLLAEISRLKASLSFYEGQKVIFEAQKKALEEEIAGLNKRLELTIKNLNEATGKNAEILAEINKIEKELRFKVGVKGQELLAERTKSYINWEEIKKKKGEKYSIWMQGELDKLQDTYKDEMETVKKTLETQWEEKIKILDVDVKKAEAAAGVEDEEAKKLKIQLEELRLRVGELEASKQHLGVKQMEIKAEMEVKMVTFAAQKSAKEKELEKMKEDCSAIKSKYEEMMKGINWEQVAHYSTTLTPEIRRISGRFGTMQIVSSGKKMNFSKSSSETRMTSSEEVSIKGKSSVNGL